MAWDAVVREVLDQARRDAGGGAALATALRAANVGPDSGAYSESAVSNWIKGRTRPPADVVLAAASLYGISLDRPLGLVTDEASDDNEVRQLRSALTRLEALVHDQLAPRGDPALSVKDVRAVFTTRSDVHAVMPLLRTLVNANRVDAMGLSLNAICQGLSDVTLAELIENGLSLHCLFLDPDGTATRAREIEEEQPAGHLADLTRTNIHALSRLREHLSDEARERLQIRTYDDPLRFNITTFDGDRSLVQVYLHGQRGLDSPTFLVEADEHEPRGLFPVFDQVMTTTWERGRVVES